jgi:uncharacterized membrane protein YbhN (UPF0104 family)/tRNA A-37 threonylcarbamoyl transferase component Bud32
VSTSSEVTREEQTLSAARSRGFALLIDDEAGRRNRRTIDGVLLAGAALVAGLAAAVARSAPVVDEDVGSALVTVLGWAPAVWRVAVVGALALSFVIVGDALLRRRLTLVRDLGVGLALVFVLGAVLARAGADSIRVEPHVFSRWGFPELRLACVLAVVTVAGPELVRPVRLLARWLLCAAGVGLVALGAALPSQALGGIALGLAAAAIARLALGSTAGVPSTRRVRAAVAALGIDVTELAFAPRQRVGSTEFLGRGADGSVLRVRVLGRDAQDTQWLARRWRLLAYRSPERSAPVGRLEQVEHEALATLLAEEAGVRVPGVVTVGLGPEDDAILVTREPDVPPLELADGDDVSDSTLEDLCRQVARLHEAGIAHGRLNLSNVVVADDGPMLVGLSAATLAAPQSALDVDVAELLVACCVLVGPERTLRQAVDAGWGESLARVLPYLQRAALTPHLRDLARTHEVGLKQLRVDVAAATGSAVPEIAPLRRIRPKDVLLMAVLIFAAYLLISQLAEIGFGTIARELGHAEPIWVVVALLLAQTALIGSGISVRGAVAIPLPLFPVVVLQAAIKFVNLTVPSSAGRIGMNLRFLQRVGASRAQALAAGAVDDVSETIVQAGLLLLVLPFVGASIDTSRFGDAGPDTRLLAALAVALLVAVVVVLAVPSVRGRVVPGMRSAFQGLWSVARVRRKRVELFGGNVASELLYSLALGATCLAYGVDLTLPKLVFVNMSASVLSSVIPSPGGIGTAEAALAGGLIAVGVDESTAFAIAVTQRISTFYLPPIWGYVSLRWLSRKGYV